MIKKILSTISIILAGISFYILVGRNGVSMKTWLALSLGPYMILGALALRFRFGIIQVIIIPFFLFYGIGAIFNIPWQIQYTYAHVSSILMLVIAGYFIVRHVIKLKIMRIILGIVVGSIFLLALKYYQRNYIGSGELKNIPHMENRLLY